jgi:signal transduction histidine kinase
VVFRSLRFRLIGSYLLVVLLAMGIAAVLAGVALDRAFLDVLRENLLAQAELVAQTIESDGGDLDSAYVVSYAVDGTQAVPEPYLQSANVIAGYHTRVIDEEGVVILSSSEGGKSASPDIDYDYRPEENSFAFRDVQETVAPPPAISLLDRVEVQRALGGEPATAVRTYDWAPDRRVLYAAYPVRLSGGDVNSIVYIATPLPRFSLGLLPTYFAPQVLGAALLAIFLAGLAGFVLARSLTRPLTHLTDAASALARGEPALAVEPSTTDELARLGEAFNTMNANLTAALDELAAEARQREAMLQGLADAVVAVDEAGQVILANEAASVLLQVAPESVEETIRLTLESGKPQSVEIAAQAQVFELLTTPLRDEEGNVSGAVAVGHDVTVYRQIDRLRTNFVSDVSHELRTPLTAIKGFVETLQNGAAEDAVVRDRFLSTLAGETERLIRVSNDLLLLTRADAGQLDLQLTPTDLGACVQRAAEQLEGLACEKRVELVTEHLGDSGLVLADADRIHQVLINLLDNAIKFTPPGGRVAASVSGHVVTVADTGPGIPADEIPHIFERFYRGDRSRARQGTDGSGLGLAIAKAIVEAHGGRIWVESKPGEGAAFHAALPPA